MHQAAIGGHVQVAAFASCQVATAAIKHQRCGYGVKARAVFIQLPQAGGGAGPDAALPIFSQGVDAFVGPGVGDSDIVPAAVAPGQHMRLAVPARHPQRRRFGALQDGRGVAAWPLLERAEPGLGVACERSLGRGDKQRIAVARKAGHGNGGQAGFGFDGGEAARVAAREATLGADPQHAGGIFD
ncbi:MAG: hypothetical protein WKG03_13985 [Telluria sp.]